MSHPNQADIEALIEALVSADVEFIVVGGVAAVLHGAPTTTIDLDIVHRRTPENVNRLVAVLGHLDARIRDPAGRDLRPNEALLLGKGQLNLTTSLGPLDPLAIRCMDLEAQAGRRIGCWCRSSSHCVRAKGNEAPNASPTWSH